MPDVAPSPVLVGLVLTAAGATLAPFAVFVARRIFPGRNVHFARWGFSHVLMLAVLMLAVGVLAPAILPRESPLFGLYGTVLVFGAGAVYIVLTAQKKEPAGWRALGFPGGRPAGPGGDFGGPLRARTARSLLAGAASYVLCLPLLYGITFLWPALYELAGGEAEPQGVVLQLLALEGSELVQAVLIAVAIGPFLEELVFRSFLQPLLVQNFSDRGGILLCALAFAFLHGEPTAFLPLFVLGVVLGAVMLRTQSLPAAWLVHALHNGSVIAVLLLYPASRELLL